MSVHQRVAVPPLDDERRRFQRIHLQIPLFIRGKDAHGEQFMELAKTLDISALGAFLASPRPLAINGFITLDDSRRPLSPPPAWFRPEWRRSRPRSSASRKLVTCTSSASSS